jgi:uncharacterized protein
MYGMPIYTTPGIYFEWLTTVSPGLVAQRTDIAGFVGIAARGPLHAPQRIESWSQFTSIFGGFIPQAYLAYSVQAFFANGGRTCWVVRVADPDKVSFASIDLLDETGNPALRLTAGSPGVWAHRLDIAILPSGQERFTLTLRLPDGTQESWRGLTLSNAACTLNKNREAGGSYLVSATRLSETGRTLAQPLSFPSGGHDGLGSLTPAHFSGNGAPSEMTWGLETLAGINEISILAVPDIMLKPQLPRETVPMPPPRCDILDVAPAPALAVDDPIEYAKGFKGFDDVEITELQWQMILQCETLKNRIAVLDMPSAVSLATDGIAWRNKFDTKYAALYYPWLCVPNPLFAPGAVLNIPPSGHIAGVYARVENQVGAHKAPANELLALALDVTAPLDDVLHGLLNENAVNVLRAYPGRGLRVAGARLLSSDTGWLYVNVRRLMLMIERSIDVNTQWIVFEPNNPEMWRDTERVISNFLDDLWRRGMLDGTSADEAYSVQCNETTNPPSETDLGRLICQIGVRPPWPAEFVIARIGRTEGNSLILEG